LPKPNALTNPAFPCLTNQPTLPLPKPNAPNQPQLTFPPNLPFPLPNQPNLSIQTNLPYLTNPSIQP